VKNAKGKIIAGIAIISILILVFIWGGSMPSSSAPDFPVAVSKDTKVSSSAAAASSYTKAADTLPASENAAEEEAREEVSKVEAPSVQSANPSKASSDALSDKGKDPPSDLKTAQSGIQEASLSVKSPTCQMRISCETILSNMDLLTQGKESIIPEDGMLFSKDSIPIKDGDTVFDVLLSQMTENKLHMEFVKSPVYDTAYIEGICNIYEFDCGETSGWQYRVNGKFPPHGCSLEKVHDGDVIEWLFTCDMGRDIGGSNSVS